MDISHLATQREELMEREKRSKKKGEDEKTNVNQQKSRCSEQTTPLFHARTYLPLRHQVKRVEQEKTEALDEEHVVAVFPHQEEGDAGGTHGKVTKHLHRVFSQRSVAQRGSFYSQIITVL